MNKMFVIICTILAVLIVIALTGCSSFFQNPPKPEITQGEFNFKLEYEINGEQRTLSDTLICQFDGYNFDEARGKTRRWKEHYENSQNNELYAYRIEDPNWNGHKQNKPKYNQIVLQNIDHYKVVFSIAPAEYFLGEPEYKGTPEMPSIQVYDTSTGYYQDPAQGEKFLEGYNFKVIDWHCDPPIQNSFK